MENYLFTGARDRTVLSPSPPINLCHRILCLLSYVIGIGLMTVTHIFHLSSNANEPFMALSWVAFQHSVLPPSSTTTMHGTFLVPLPRIGKPLNAYFARWGNILIVF